MAVLVKNPPANSGDMRHGFDSQVRKIPWRRACKPLQYSCLENLMDRAAWQAPHVSMGSQRLSDLAHINGDMGGGSDGKESACNARDPGSIPGLKGSFGEGNGNPLPYSCLENSTDRRAWRPTVHGQKELDTSEQLNKILENELKLKLLDT